MSSGSRPAKGPKRARRLAAAAGAIAAALARILLLLYPSPFRRDVGAAVVRDIRAQVATLARERGGWAAGCRLLGITASLVANGIAEWRQRSRTRSAGARHEPGEARPAGARRGALLCPLSLLDFKLGVRMMARHPALTLIGLLGLTVVVAIGVVFVAAVDIVYATLPFEDGERLVAIENWDLQIHNQEYRNLHDYRIWRDELETVEDLGAYRNRRRNLIDDEGHTQAVTVAEITAAGFRLPGVPPLFGRPLVEDDMRPGAPRVLVIGHDIWRNDFGADPDIVGQEVRLGALSYTVVGVMPRGFAFPLAHDLWTPFAVDSTVVGRRQGPSIRVFGRLAENATLATARAELDALGRRLSADFPDTHELIRPSLIPYTAQPWDDMEGVEIPALALTLVLLLVVIAANVGTLLYARTAARRGELLVRTALGASRSNLVGQLFVEALVIAMGAAVLGIGVAAIAIERLNVFIDSLTTGGGAWFWMRFTLSPMALVWALALAILGAVIAGGLPALGATGRNVQAGLQGLSGGIGGMGRTWTTLIVAQVAFAVAVLPTTVFLAWEMAEHGVARPSFPADEYVVGHLLLDPAAAGGVETLARQSSDQASQSDENSGSTTSSRPGASYTGAGDEAGPPDPDAPDFETRYANLQGDLARRLEADLGATGVTYVAHYPGDYPVVRIEVESRGVDPVARTQAAGSEVGETDPSVALRLSGDGVLATSHQAGFTRVEPGFFDQLEVAQLAGRRFTRADATSRANVVIVNRSFVDRVLGGAAATGLRIRYASSYRAGGIERQPAGTSADTWYEIVGVVEDFPPRPTEPGETMARLYHPLDRGQVYPAGLIAHLPRDTANAVKRTRDIAAAVDPNLRFNTLQTLTERLAQLKAAQRIAGSALSLITLSVALLSMAGLYALLSYAVVRRHREIGIRRALGSQDARILKSLFGRVLAQLAIGAAVGLGLAALLSTVIGAELGDPRALGFVAGVFAALLGAALLAALGPARRGLRIAPIEALRE